MSDIAGNSGKDLRDNDLEQPVLANELLVAGHARIEGALLRSEPVTS